MDWTRDTHLGIQGPVSAIPAPRLSNWSSASVPDSLFCSADFVLAAGMVVFEPSTRRIVVIEDTKDGIHFLPKGRKDIGESLQEAALREAYEESGYKTEFLPLPHITRAPIPEGTVNRPALTTEPIFVELYYWKPDDPFFPTGGQYIAHWFVGQIVPDAIYEAGTGTKDEQTYRTHLLTREEAIERLTMGSQALVVDRAWELLKERLAMQN